MHRRLNRDRHSEKRMKRFIRSSYPGITGVHTKAALEQIARCGGLVFHGKMRRRKAREVSG